jgi:hypothetical protein
MWVDDWKGIDHLELVGAFRDGTVVFTDLTISTEKITTDTPRIPIGAIRQEVIDRVRKIPDYADVASQFLAYDDPARLSPEKEASVVKAAATGKAAAARNAKTIRGSGLSPGRPRLTDDFLRDVALTYLELFPTESKRIAIAVTERLRETLGNKSLKVNTVKSWIYRARQEGWLVRTGKGRPDAEPGWRLKEWQELRERADS